ncbi:MAG TPA: thiosulfohydrolase SoxB, partial [Rhizobiales bacterium]|nr:thiosulfohydrolase SoxB [Hyphomicrobiales bacterium]
PYFQQGGDMVRVGGLGFDMDAAKTIGKRITNLHLTRNGAPLEAGKKYQVAGWASVNKETGTGGRPVWELVKDYIREKKTIDLTTNDAVRLFNG